MSYLYTIYGIWGALAFLVPMLILLPFFHLLAMKDEWHKNAVALNRLWARIFFPLALLPYKIDWKFRPSTQKAYVFCSNHNSWLDIAAFGLILKGDHSFMGKEGLRKIPLFGPMFAKLHILVDRNDPESRSKAVQDSRDALQKQRSVVFFPEGGIRSPHPSKLAEFKDGAFKVAIEQQVPIVPVAFLNNWYIFPKSKKVMARWRPVRAVVLPPIETKGKSIEDLEFVKQETFEALETELQKHFPKLALHEN